MVNQYIQTNKPKKIIKKIKTIQEFGEDLSFYSYESDENQKKLISFESAAVISPHFENSN